MTPVIRSTIVVAILATLSCPGVHSFSYKGQTIPVDRSLPTAAQFRQDITAFYYRTILEAYEECGNRNPRWDDAAIRFLRNYVQYISPGVEGPSLLSLVEDGKSLEAVGCDDPVVLSCYGLLLRRHSRPIEAGSILERAMSGFEDSSYKKYRAALVTRYLYDIQDTSYNVVSHSLDALMEKTIKLFVESLHDGSYRADEQRLTLEIHRTEYSSFFRKHWDRLYGLMIAEPAIDPYVLKVIAGRHYLYNSTAPPIIIRDEEDAARAIAYRRENAEKGVKLLKEAWEMRPDFPEAPQLMMLPTIQGYSGQDETPRLWFDRAVAAQMDHPPAYRSMIGFLTPKWGGSFKALYDFGIECLETERFDTNVPWQFFVVLRRMTGESNGNKDHWEDLKTLELLDSLCEGYASMQPATGSDRAGTMRLAVLWYCERWSDAKRVMDELGDRVATDVFGYFGARYERVRRHISIFGSEYADEINAADELYMKRRVPEAIEAFKGILAKCGDDEYVYAYVTRQINRLEVYARFMEGEWMNLAPDTEFTDWLVGNGEWSVDEDGSITGTTNLQNQNASLTCDWEFGSRFEIDGEIEFVSAKSFSWSGTDETPKLVREDAFNAGIVIVGSKDDVDIIFYKDRNRLHIRNALSNFSSTDYSAGVKQKNMINIKYWDGLVSVYINGRQIRAGSLTRRIAPSEGANLIRFAGYGWNDDVIVRFSDFRIRLLSEEPTSSK